MGLLIYPETMASISHSMVFDGRSHLSNMAQGKKDFDVGQIPGAEHASLDQHLGATTGDTGWHPLPERKVLAARLWWLCRWLGNDDTLIFDGGLDRWIQQGLPVSTLQEIFSQVHFTSKPTLTNMCQIADVLGSFYTLLDKRESARYRGEVEPLNAFACHIPGASSAPFSDNMSEGYLTSKAVLRQRFEILCLTPDSPLACNRVSGVTAIHNALALLIAGYPEHALCPCSCSEWITGSDLPIETA